MDRFQKFVFILAVAPPLVLGIPVGNTLKRTGEICGDPIHDIIEGEPSARGKWPWIVALVVDHSTPDIFVCGASLINKEWALTAAHCVHGIPEDYLLYAKVGAFNLTANDESEKIRVEAIIEHPDYVYGGNGVNDLALLKLESPSDITDPCVAIIDLPPDSHGFDSNVFCWIIGWGYTDYSHKEISPILNERKVNVLRNEQCQLRWSISPVRPSIRDYHICVDETDGSSACYGDSGSPLQCYLPLLGKWAFAGVSSWGSGACRDFPSVYMRVSSYNTWINEVITEWH